jgi:septal ring factor EnvC (AmiA/AmiB activator)
MTQYYELSTDQNGTHFYAAIPDPTYELKTDLAEVQQQCSRLQHSLTQALNEADDLRRELTVANASISELKAQNELANEALTAIAKQLGFDSFSDDNVPIAIADLYTQIEGREAALRGSATFHKDRKEVVSKLEDNLTRANSDRLSELTTIMRMVQALEDTPQDKIDGAIYLIKRVIYNSICKIDPSQAIEL